MGQEYPQNKTEKFQKVIMLSLNDTRGFINSVIDQTENM